MATEEEIIRAKFERDKFVLTPHETGLGATSWSFKPTPEDKAFAIKILHVEPVNFDTVIGVPVAVESKQKLTTEQIEAKRAARLFGVKKQAEEFSQQQPVFYDKAGSWWLWNFESFRWEMVDEVDILNMINQATGKDVIMSRNRQEILNSLKQEGRLNAPEEVRDTWIQFQDIIVDVTTGQEFQASPNYFVTNPLPWKLHEERHVSTPTMDKIFEEWVGAEHIKTLYEILAYCLLPSYPIHRLFCLIGEGSNGKSCFLKLLSNFVGKNNITSTELDTLLKSRFEVTKLYKKLVCVMGETNFNEISQTSVLKKLTGQDTIGFEYKNKTPFEGLNYAKIIIATNSLPTTTDKTTGFYRRWTIIDFPNRFTEEKEILNEIPKEEYEILAVKSLIILKDLLTDRRFHNEGSVEQRAEKYEAKSDFVTKFISDNVIQDTEGFITKADFYKRFLAWSKENRHREISENSLGINLKKRGIEEGRKYFEWLYDGKGGQARIWLGIKWKN